MEEITIQELQYKDRLDAAIEELKEANEEIKALEEEIDGQNQIIRELRAEIDKISHEDEVVITTKHKIDSIEICFEKGAKR